MSQKKTLRLMPLAYISIAFLSVGCKEQNAKQTTNASLLSTNSITKSDSALMFLTDREVSVRPLSEPTISKFIVETDETAVYDTATQKETLISNNPQESKTDTPNHSEPFEGLLPSALFSSSLSPSLSSPSISARVVGTDGRKRITNTTDYPWRTIAKLETTYPDGRVSSCTGAIIDNFHILTAGHCAYSRGHGGYGKIKAYPGQNGKYTPFSYANSTKVRTYTQWTTNRDPNHDWALITLDRNIGLYTGWMGLKTASTNSALYKAKLNVSGYPLDRLQGTLWNSSDKGHSANTYRHFYKMDTYGGESGAPVWRADGNDRYILSIHAYGDSAATPGVTNAGTRINTDKYNKITQWRKKDIAPKDKPDLIDDGNAFSGFSPTKISSGKSLSIHNDVRNIGTANSGSFYVSYYASKDTTISSSDYYLGRTKVSSITPFAKANAKWKGTFPNSIIPSGSYYVGWIIDSTHAIKEYSETNNTGYKKSPKLIVSGNNGGGGGGTTLALISPIGTIKDSTPTYKWKALAGASYYQLWVNDSTGNKVKLWYTATSVGCQRGTGYCSITPNTTLAKGNASWKIRPWQNNKYGSWSAAKSFKVTAGGNGGGSRGGSSLALISPSGTIKDSTPSYKWKALAGASYYQLWVNDSTGNKMKRWYTATSVGCQRGTGYCSITPNTTLANGNASWKIRTWQNNKYGSWSAAKSFKVTAGGNGGGSGGGSASLATLISPSGTISNSTPTYKWKAISGASYYYLWVTDSKGNKIRHWYSAYSLGCNAGKGICSIKPYRTLAKGKVTWKIRAWKNYRYTPWTKTISFYKR